jgi:radical SAM superfamily enzyme YgiQ (UPF0313 family)
MKIFFIVPPSIHYIEPYAHMVADKSNGARVYLGLLYLAAYLRKSTGINVKIIDAVAEQYSLEDLAEIIEHEKPDMVGFSVLTFNLLNCLAVCEIIKMKNPNTKICFGGWHPTLYSNETLKFDCVDYIVIGEGEITFSELVSKNSPKGVNGVGYKENGKIIINPPREVIKQLDEIPFPAYDLIDIQKYSNILACEGIAITIITSRGCPHKCIFCDMRKTPYRYRSPENMIEEITSWTDKGVKEFFIQDDNFTSRRSRAITFCKMLIDLNLKIKYKISSRVDYLDDELVRYLKKSGCYRIYFGVESGSQKILDNLQKGITTDNIIQAFKLAQKHKIDACAYIMIGAPEETEDDLNLTMKLIKKIKPAHLHCSICTPMPKTLLYQNLLENGAIKNDYWLEFAKSPDPNFKTPFSNDDRDWRTIQNSIQKKFYMNPRIIFKELLKTRDLKKIISKAKTALNIIRA